MADQTQGSIEIAADRAAVMAVIADFEAYPEWASGVEETEVLETGPDGRATRVRFEVAQGPLRAGYTLRYTYDDDREISWTFVEGTNIRDLQGSYTLEPTEAGTKVTYRTKVDAAIPMLGFMKRQIEKKIIDVALKGLKKRVEGR